VLRGQPNEVYYSLTGADHACGPISVTSLPGIRSLTGMKIQGRPNSGRPYFVLLYR
jgi:hypothetical protein